MKPPSPNIPASALAKNTNSRLHHNSTGGYFDPHASQPIKVLLADDHPVVRLGIVGWLEREANLRVVGEAADGQEALRKTRELVPDVLLTDIDMPHMNGFALTQAVHKELPQVKVLLLSQHAGTGFALRCIQSGATGYILKQASPDEFVKAIEAVHAGEVFFSPDVNRVVLNHMVRGNGPGPDPSDLTEREREVLTWIAQGLSNKEIACRLDIGTRTVETHRERLMRKLQIHSIAGLTKFAFAKGLITLPDLSLAPA